jgi:hypothetical protein
MVHAQGKTDGLFHGFNFLRGKDGDQAANFGFGDGLQIKVYQRTSPRFTGVPPRVAHCATRQTRQA